MEVPGILSSPPSTCDPGCTFLPSAQLTGSRSIVGSDKSVGGSEPAFFKESMKREDMIGTRIRLVLWDTSESFKGMFSISRKGYLHPGKGYKDILSTNLMSIHSDVSCAAYLDKKSEDLIQNLTEKHKYKVSCRVSQNRVQNALNARVSTHARSPGYEKNDRECKKICNTMTYGRCIRISRAKLRRRVRTYRKQVLY